MKFKYCAFIVFFLINDLVDGSPITSVCGRIIFDLLEVCSLRNTDRYNHTAAVELTTNELCEIENHIDCLALRDCVSASKLGLSYLEISDMLGGADYTAANMFRSCNEILNDKLGELITEIQESTEEWEKSKHGLYVGMASGLVAVACLVVYGGVKFRAWHSSAAYTPNSQRVSIEGNLSCQSVRLESYGLQELDK